MQKEKIISILQRPVVIVGLLLIALIPYLYISIYANPSADDFTYAFKGRNFNLYDRLIQEYLYWNGRYISNLLVLINPIAFGYYWLYKATPVFLILITIAATCFFIKTISKNRINHPQAFIYAIALTLLFLHQMPITSEGLYWYTGAVTYQGGSAFMLFYLATLTLLFQGRHFFGSKFFHFIVTLFLLFITMGFSEIHMIILLLLSLIVFAIVLLKRLDHKMTALFILIAASIFAAVVYFAPGNAIRASHFPDKHQFFYSIGMSMAQTLRFFLEWTSSLPLLLSSVLYYFFNRKLSVGNNIFARSFYLTPLFATLLLFFVIFMGSFPAYWSTGLLGQHRTMNVAYFIFLLMWFICITTWFNKVDILSKELNIVWKLALTLLIWLSFLFTKNGYRVLDDLRSGSAQRYNQLMEERYTLIMEPKDTIYLKTVSNPPKTLFVLEITEMPDHWLNRAYNVFFDLDDKKIIGQD